MILRSREVIYTNAKAAGAGSSTKTDSGAVLESLHQDMKNEKVFRPRVEAKPVTGMDSPAWKAQRDEEAELIDTFSDISVDSGRYFLDYVRGLLQNEGGKYEEFVQAVLGWKFKTISMDALTLKMYDLFNQNPEIMESLFQNFKYKQYATTM
ncbi:hypothetical protein MPTK1_5g02120 [Marchantia polymorpha subsp. ruderalis]|nr:hypothetical protein MARPO_0147s0007 [Marchantia polymorpha]BBN10248.1 hypothetical protein Mp_5g02120 [Marchantia polymorpha subsp. ruderalis]|eukprot:PTQ29114.1 hypothetical protein MARPO_0147s0007 [Marchantia polymorpha]